MRRAAVVCYASLLGCAFVLFSGVAGAAPAPPPCSFTLGAPVADSGAVTTTVRSTGCAPLAVPYLAVVCLQAGDAAPFCSQARGTEPAQVSLPYQPGASYTASGRGCARWEGVDPAPNCQLLGPATLGAVATS